MRFCCTMHSRTLRKEPLSNKDPGIIIFFSLMKATCTKCLNQTPREQTTLTPNTVLHLIGTSFTCFFFNFNLGRSHSTLYV